MQKMNMIGFLLVAATASTVGCSYHKPENSAEPQFDLAAHCLSKEAITKQRAQRALPCNADALLRRFDQSSVANFDKAMPSAKHGQVFLPPNEYSDVVDCGKPAVPGLIRLIANRDGYIGDAAWGALDEITNRRFGTHEPAPNPPDAVQRAAVAEKYQKWWEENKAKSETDWLLADIGSNDEQGREAIHKLGISGDRAAIPALKSLLGNTYLGPRAAVALARLGDESAVPVLVDYYMASDSEPLRETGICEAYALTGQTMNFNPNGSPEERKEALKRWHRWHEQRVGQLGY
jgi:PBS lyase HEAT-like repeat-containing protein